MSSHRRGDDLLNAALRDHVPSMWSTRCCRREGEAACRFRGLFVCCCQRCQARSLCEVMNRITSGVLKVPLSWIYGIFILFLIVLALRFLLDAGRAALSVARGAGRA